MADFFERRTVKAKKEHTCEMCGMPIKLGEEYVVAVGVWENEFFSTKYHIECDAVLEEFHEGGEFDFEEIREKWVEKHCRFCKHYNEDDCGLGPNRECWCDKFTKEVANNV